MIELIPPKELSEKELLPLNRSEHMFWALEGYIGSITQPYMLRFDGPVEAEQVRQALRELTRIIARMRSVVVPTLLSYKLKILPDDEVVNELFIDAFRVIKGIDAGSLEELAEYQNQILNDAIQMERGLPWKARFIPHPQTPALILAVHHIVGDGRSVMVMLRAIMDHLNGRPMQRQPLVNPSMVPAITPPKLIYWPAVLMGWWKNTRRDAKARNKNEQVVYVSQRTFPRTTRAVMHFVQLKYSYTEMNALAKAMGTKFNSLFAALVANSFLATQPDNPNATAVIRMPADLRRYFLPVIPPEIGNFVAAITVRATHQPTIKEQIAAIEKQVKDSFGRFARRENAVPLLMYELLPLMGRRLFGYFFVKSKEKGMKHPSCFFSNLGNADFINPEDAKLKAFEFWPSTQGVMTSVGLVCFNEKVYFPVGFPTGEMDDEAVAAYYRRFYDQLDPLMAEYAGAIAAAQQAQQAPQPDLAEARA